MGCSTNQSTQKTTTHITYDLFNTQSSGEFNAKQPPVEPFEISTQSSASALAQLSTWLIQHCEQIHNNWQSCLKSLHHIKQVDTQVLETQLKESNIDLTDLYLAISLQNKAELLLNRYNDRKHKIQAAHLFIQAKTLLQSGEDTTLFSFKQLLTHLIEQQLTIMVNEDGFLAVIIAPPPFLQKKNNSTHYAIINWSAQALMRKNSHAKSIRKKSKDLSHESCLISIETAIKYENKLKKKWATSYLSSLNSAIKSAQSQCYDFTYNNYFFELVLLSFNKTNWAFLLNDTQPNDTQANHPVVLQHSIFNELTDSQPLIQNYLAHYNFDGFMHYHIAKTLPFIQIDDPCFMHNSHFINCYALLENNRPIKQLKDRDFLIGQLTYVFPYELLLHQLNTRLEHYQSELHIEFDERMVMETLFKQKLSQALTSSEFTSYELKLLYAYYAIFNLSDSFLSEKDKVTISDYFFTQDGYQLKWELSGIVQNILTMIQHQYYSADKKKPNQP